MAIVTGVNLSPQTGNFQRPDVSRQARSSGGSSSAANITNLYAAGGGDNPPRLPGQPAGSVEAARSEIFGRRSGNDAYTQRQRSRIQTEIWEATIPDLNARSLAANRAIQRQQLTDTKRAASEEPDKAENRAAGDTDSPDRISSAASGPSVTIRKRIDQMKTGYLDNANTAPSAAQIAPKINTKLETINVSDSINEMRNSLKGGSVNRETIAMDSGLPDSKLGKKLDVTI